MPLNHAISLETYPILATYSAGWAAFDGDTVCTAFTAQGVYIDMQVTEGVRGQALADYVRSLAGQFTLKSGAHHLLPDGQLEAHWSMFNPAGEWMMDGKDHITFEDGKIARVVGSW